MSKSLAHRPPSAKGCRFVAYSQGFNRRVKGPFSWVTPAAWVYRQKLGTFAAKHGVFGDMQEICDGLKSIFGRHWAFHCKESILKTRLSHVGFRLVDGKTLSGQSSNNSHAGAVKAEVSATNAFEKLVPLLCRIFWQFYQHGPFLFDCFFYQGANINVQWRGVDSVAFSVKGDSPCNQVHKLQWHEPAFQQRQGRPLVFNKFSSIICRTSL